MALRRPLSTLIAALAALALAAVASAQPCPTTSAAIIGPGTPCSACWTNPLTNTDGSALVQLLQVVDVYLDPPATGPVIGTTPATFTTSLGAVNGLTNGVAGAPAGVNLCANFATLPATGPHTLSVSVATGASDPQSPGSSPPVAFWFQATPPAIGFGAPLYQ